MEYEDNIYRIQRHAKLLKIHFSMGYNFSQIIKKSKQLTNIKLKIVMGELGRLGLHKLS